MLLSPFNISGAKYDCMASSWLITDHAQETSLHIYSSRSESHRFCVSFFLVRRQLQQIILVIHVYFSPPRTLQIPSVKVNRLCRRPGA
jgi:hypothetical protein